jgi:orotate phosphoribosyltransferase-like protein
MLMTKYREILRLNDLGLSQQDIVDSCNVSKKTVSRGLKRAGELNISWLLDENETDEVLAEKFFPFCQNCRIGKDAARFRPHPQRNCSVTE